ncbi:hypothetical protein [Streptomyces sp. NPDC088915]|uniref:hypothetical protein n=1 Tax=Streptomyces sp. NPDC088915 TaxID=3365912 RepID=UPI00380E9E69
MSKFSGSARRRVGRLVVAAAAVALTAGAVPTAQAAGTADPEVAAALQRIADASGSIADCKLVYERDPALSEQIPCPWVNMGADGPEVAYQTLNYNILPDGTYDNLDDVTMNSTETKALVSSWTNGGNTSTGDLVEVPEEGASGGTGFSTRVAAGRWKLAKVTETNYSYLGSVIYRYVHYANFKYAGGKVTAWGTRGDYLSNESSVVDDQGRIANTATKLSASTAYSYMKHKIALVAPVYGTYAYNYPWVKIKMTGSGATSFTGAAL